MVWKKSRVLPRIVLHHENNIGKETLPSHSFLFVRTKEGKGFVVDPTGCQFGFPDWFYSDVQYERFFTGPEPEELDLEEELVWFERMAAEDSFTGKAVTLREELAALKTREIARLCD